MSYSRDDVKAITDKVIDMAKADGVEVEFSGGERSATRFANSNITANMVQFDRNVSVTVHHGTRSATASSRDLDDVSLKEMVADAQARAEKARENQEALPLIEGPQDYIEVDAALPGGVSFGPAERAQMVKQSLDVCQKKGVIGSGYIPKVHLATCSANSKGLFAYYQYAEASFILTCRTPDGSCSPAAGPLPPSPPFDSITAFSFLNGTRTTMPSRRSSRASLIGENGSRLLTLSIAGPEAMPCLRRRSYTS